jgi:hypothetical protein
MMWVIELKTLKSQGTDWMRQLDWLIDHLVVGMETRHKCMGGREVEERSRDHLF